MTTETATPSPENQGGNTERLLRAQAAELQALRERVADLPDADTLTQWRASHERLSQLQADLPAWRQQLQEAHQAEQERLQKTVAEQQQALTQAALQQEMQSAFTQAGGNVAFFDAWRELGGKHVTRGEDGSLQINGKPLSEALAGQREDQLLGVFYHPRYGSGGGSRGGIDARVNNAQDMHRMTTDQKFRAAFGGAR